MVRAVEEKEVAEKKEVTKTEVLKEEKAKTLHLSERLLCVQAELKAPKNLYNDFGKYKYRNTENILEGLKPLLKKYNLILTLTDSVELIGDRYYICATATVGDYTSETFAKAYAREPLSKKGMDESQITGTASSYARKYALNGLFLLDDTKDADTNEHANETKSREVKEIETKPIHARKGAGPSTQVINEEQFNQLVELCKKAERETSYIAKSMGVDSLINLPANLFPRTKAGLESLIFIKK